MKFPRFVDRLDQIRRDKFPDDDDNEFCQRAGIVLETYKTWQTQLSNKPSWNNLMTIVQNLKLSRDEAGWLLFAGEKKELESDKRGGKKLAIR